MRKSPACWSLMLCFLACGSSAAADSTKWLHVAVDGPSVYYVDEASILLVGDHVEAFELVDFPDDGSTWRSMRSKVRYKCTDGTAAVIRNEFFAGPMGTGAIIATQVKDAPYTASQPGTPGFRLTAVVCSRAQGMGSNNSFKPKPLRGSA